MQIGSGWCTLVQIAGATGFSLGQLGVGLGYLVQVIAISTKLHKVALSCTNLHHICLTWCSLVGLDAD